MWRSITSAIMLRVSGPIGDGDGGSSIAKVEEEVLGPGVDW
jgi:hypothetical protein